MTRSNKPSKAMSANYAHALDAELNNRVYEKCFKFTATINPNDAVRLSYWMQREYKGSWFSAESGLINLYLDEDNTIVFSKVTGAVTHWSWKAKGLDMDTFRSALINAWEDEQLYKEWFIN